MTKTQNYRIDCEDIRVGDRVVGMDKKRVARVDVYQLQIHVIFEDDSMWTTWAGYQTNVLREIEE